MFDSLSSSRWHERQSTHWNQTPHSFARKNALEISKSLGGLPIALTQIGGFIRQRKLRLQDFLPLYERNRTKIDARKAPGEDYEHTLRTVWYVSFEKLTEDSTRLLNVLAFLEPDNIAEDLFLNGFKDVDDMYSFLSDEMELVANLYIQQSQYRLTQIQSW